MKNKLFIGLFWGVFFLGLPFLSSATSLTPDVIEMSYGQCEEVFGPECSMLKIDSVDFGQGVFPLPLEPDHQVTLYNFVMINSDYYAFDWSSTFDIDAVIVKGAWPANVFDYDPASFGDTGLYAPNDTITNIPKAISSISFCYDVSIVDPVPEPATMLLLGTGLVGVAGVVRRKKKNQA